MKAGGQSYIKGRGSEDGIWGGGVGGRDWIRRKRK